MKILRNILEHGFPALWILKKSGNVLGFRVRKKSKLKTMSCPFHWKATQGSGKSTPFAGWYRKCRERPSIMKWMWYKSGGFPALRNLSTTKTRYAVSGAGRGIPRPLSGAGGTAIWRSTSRPVEPYRLRCHWSGTGNQRKLPVYGQWYLLLPLKGGGRTWRKCGFTLPT